MPSIETIDRYQKAIYCAFAGTDRYGNIVREDPVEIDVRWEYKDIETVDAAGLPLRLDAWAAVNQVIAVGSTLILGYLVNWLGTGSAEEDEDVMEVVKYIETPDVKNRFLRREVGLRRYRATQPEIG